MRPLSLWERAAVFPEITASVWNDFKLVRSVMLVALKASFERS